MACRRKSVEIYVTGSSSRWPRGNFGCLPSQRLRIRQLFAPDWRTSYIKATAVCYRVGARGLRLRIFLSVRDSAFPISRFCSQRVSPWWRLQTTIGTILAGFGGFR